ncbi:hypothetical protein RM844_26320 [Streptomyces sp. DSM 44915]|uniref:AraC family transcriptional regulator n=1 Tax=Streptomyces chisholmiae TaxID=3075540 RepID=A0ABU2JXS9_9ACTN|nr:hypothetical protein [Streptomyces sp. DSM 44915]MDT0269805.1 hypothetical protein [Streptomyces sp. DSM 44915]
MRDVPVAEVDHLPLDILPIATEYPLGIVPGWHQHRGARFPYVATGTILMETDAGGWTVPGERGVLIPLPTRHRVRMLDVCTSSVYIEPAAVP